MRNTPDKVTELADGEIFVYGSNMRGAHTEGGALCAVQNFGAAEGVAEGANGRAYAIPTQGANYETLHPNHIRKAVERFLRYAAVHPELTFLVIKIGCGNAGLKPSDIAPLFQRVPVGLGVIPPNVVLPVEFSAAAAVDPIPPQSPASAESPAGT